MEQQMLMSGMFIILCGYQIQRFRLKEVRIQTNLSGKLISPHRVGEIAKVQRQVVLNQMEEKK